MAHAIRMATVGFSNAVPAGLCTAIGGIALGGTNCIINPKATTPAELRNFGKIGTYNTAYGDNIHIYGLSLSKQIAGLSVGAELSYRQNMQDIGRGTHKLVAARYTFRRLFLAGLTALLADAVGFAVLMVIDIPVIRDLALTASIGVAVLIFTNLLLLPVFLSYAGVSAKAAARSLREERLETSGRGLGAIWSWLDRFTTRGYAFGAIATAIVLAAIGFAVSLQLKIGDLDPGAPELRADSRYNRDNAFITANYALSSDQFAVIVRTEKEGCLKYPTLVDADRLACRAWRSPTAPISSPAATRESASRASPPALRRMGRPPASSVTPTCGAC